jgi:AcrR family transcriptional regulator
MPTPSRTSLPAIVLAARRLLEADGLEQLTMASVARAVGVRPPSLYKHVHDRDDLVRLISNHAVAELAERLADATASHDPREDLQAMARAHRVFAHDYPETYRLLWSRLPEEWRVDADLNARASEPVLQAVAALVGAPDRLEAARTFVAWAQGFVSMELAGAFRLGGDVDAAFEYGLVCLTDALSRQVRTERQRRGGKSRSGLPSSRRAGR